MSSDNRPTHYEVLEVMPDATPAQIREAYLRVKSTYGKDSVALYTLIDPQEREEMLRNIEEAYLTLSDEERRRNYDACHESIDAPAREESIFSQPAPVISIDRTPPMSSSPEDLLIPPVTSYERRNPSPLSSSPFGSERNDRFERAESHFSSAASMMSPDPAFAMPMTTPVPGQTQVDEPVAPSPQISSAEAELFRAEPVASRPAPPRPDSKFPDLPGDLSTELEGQTEWPGSLLRRVREARRISIEEMANITKVSKAYLFAIEDENFAKLPASVFVRGFVTQVARILRLPSLDVSTAYMNRFNRHRPESKK